MSDNDDVGLCGIDGDDNSPITHKSFNRWAARSMKHHLVPLKVQVADHGQKIDELNDTINDWLTRLDASFKTLKTLIWIVGGVISAVVLLANYPHEVVAFIQLFAKK